MESGKDQMNEPAWTWLSDRAKRRATALRGKRRGTSLVAKSAAHVLDLARRAGVDAEALASRIPADTLRRLKFPYLTQVQDDGTRKYEHDIGIVEGVKSLMATDRGTGGTYDAPTPRDETGKFVKQ